MKVMLSLLLIAMAVQAQAQNLDVQAISKGYTTYVGEDINNLTVTQDGVTLGQESFEVRYGKAPTDTNTIVKTPLTEPFVLAHSQRTPYVFVFAHGITDSAFQGKDLARSLYAQGHNFLSLRLAGHGIDTPNVNTITLESWRQSMDQAIEQAKLLGDKVVLIGLSTGSALLVDRVYRRSDDIAAIIPVAPAIGISNIGANKWLKRLEKIPGLVPFIGDLKERFTGNQFIGSANKEETDVRQLRKDVNALNVLYQLGKAVQAHMKNGELVPVPGLLVSSTNDKSIDLAVLPHMMNVWPTGEWLVQSKSVHSGMVYNPAYVAYDAPDTDGVSRPFVSISEANPEYDAMITRINLFMDCNGRMKQASQ